MKTHLLLKGIIVWFDKERHENIRIFPGCVDTEYLTNYIGKDSLSTLFEAKIVEECHEEHTQSPHRK